MKYSTNEEVFSSIEDKWFKEEKEKGKDIEFEDIFYHNVKNIIERIRAEDRKALLLDVEEKIKKIIKLYDDCDLSLNKVIVGHILAAIKQEE